MLDIKKNQDGSTLEFVLDGRLDTITAPQLEEEVKASLDGITELVFDFSNLAYVSSAGLRAFRHVYMDMRQKHGVLIARNVSKAVMEVFEITGFTRLFKFE